MHIYICPYCPPNSKALLFKTKIMETFCDHKKPFFDKDRECKKDKFKCKVSMKCKKCGEVFKISDEFLKSQKRKIKDG
tara:strand:- start:874 stop:1107 length:234 start_codon:yes stop_codon:yes gene_type:complete